ncbi:MAG TPA: mannose-6-phosphate isomerase, partial [Porphyromonadaceae bacterium]|nr:mannose-6-phosphate isomerase [Porphyromonadaceae bacterium]
MWKFKPIYKPTIWGGYKIARLKRFESDERIGECWALSGIDGRVSAVEGGCDDGLSIRQLIDRDGAALLGKKNFKRFGDTFPLLIKLIDASDTLSVQVHPDDEMAQRRGLPYGKTEMWYV